ncbi:sigma-70 family RNA polymerase sigma factor [Sinomonas albida]|uniref:RNA polymerase sigma factor n=1 Tax=Sinomonas albida TaxID=369942 RepID=UPI00301B417C
MRVSVLGSSVSTANDEEDDSPAEAEFVAFYRRHYWLIFAFAARRLSDEETAREVAADTFRVAWSKLSERGDRELAWLYGIARNLIGNEYRRQLRERALLHRIQQEAALGDTDSTAELMREALLELRYKDRDILYLTYWEELSAARLAEVLGCSEASAWKRVSRARKALKDILTKKGHGHGNA